MNNFIDDYVATIVDELSITHHGTKGMKWKNKKGKQDQKKSKKKLSFLEAFSEAKKQRGPLSDQLSPEQSAKLNRYAEKNMVWKDPTRRKNTIKKSSAVNSENETLKYTKKIPLLNTGVHEIAPKHIKPSPKKTPGNGKAILHSGVKGMKWHNKKAQDANPELRSNSKSMPSATSKDKKDLDKLWSRLQVKLKRNGSLNNPDIKRLYSAMYKAGSKTERKNILISDKRSNYDAARADAIRKSDLKRGDYKQAYLNGNR